MHASFEFQRCRCRAATIACSGLTWVGARPDQRRRGLLNAMIDTHFARSLARGEPVSALFAAEHAIYGRFGYGSAADDVRVKIARGAALRDVAGLGRAHGAGSTTVDVDAAQRRSSTPCTGPRARDGPAGSPATATRGAPRRALADPPAWREGGEPLRIVTVLDAAGAVRAYATVPAQGELGRAAARPGPCSVREAVAVDAAATHRLWSFLLDLDLTATVEGPMLPVDDTAAAPARRPARRRAQGHRQRLGPAARPARRPRRTPLRAPLDVVLDVTDTRLPANAGRWRLTTGERGADDGTWPADGRPGPTTTPT